MVGLGSVISKSLVIKLAQVTRSLRALVFAEGTEESDLDLRWRRLKT